MNQATIFSDLDKQARLICDLKHRISFLSVDTSSGMEKRLKAALRSIWEAEDGLGRMRADVFDALKVIWGLDHV